MIFSIIAFITLCISICIKDRIKSLRLQSINCLCEALYDLTINAYTAATLGFVNFIRSFLFIKKEKFSKAFYFALLFIFELLIITNCVFTWNGIISLLPTTGAMIRTFCLWQTKMKYVRLSGIASGALFSMYYIYYHGWFMVIGYIFLLIVSLYQVYTVDLKTKSSEKPSNKK